MRDFHRSIERKSKNSRTEVYNSMQCFFFSYSSFECIKNPHKHTHKYKTHRPTWNSKQNENMYNKVERTMPIVFCVLLLLRQSPNSFFLENYFRRSVFSSCSLVTLVYSCSRCTHIIIVCFFFSPLGGVISYVDDRILTHLITFADADAGAGIQCVGGLCLCYRNKRFQWCCMQFLRLHKL